jgi:hypothetical protein
MMSTFPTSTIVNTSLRMPPQPLTLTVCRRPAACVPMRRSCMVVVSISTHAHVRAGGLLSLCLISNDVAATHHEDSESLGVLVPCVVVLTWARCPPPHTPAPRISRLLRVHILTYKDESCRSHPTCALCWCGTSLPRGQLGVRWGSVVPTLCMSLAR